MSLQSAFPVQHQYGDPAFNQTSWAQQTYTSALGTSLASPPASTNTSTSSPTQTTLYNTYNATSALEQPSLNATANQFGYNMTTQVSPNHSVSPQQTAAVWARHAAPNNKMGENLSSWHENYRWVIIVVRRNNVSERDLVRAVRGTFLYEVRSCVRCGTLDNWVFLEVVFVVNIRRSDSVALLSKK